MTLRVFEAFAGVGSQRMALRNLGIDHEIVAIAEIDKFAIKSYEAIHGETNNLGDISQIKTADIPDHDLFTYSFPCQDISVAGKGLGLDEGSDTRSGLLWECQKVIAVKKPKYLLLENVKNLVGKKHKYNFDKWLEWLEEQGYTNYWQVLNAKNYGVPQNRERVFVVSILGEHEPYEFPEPVELESRLKDVLENEVEEKFYLDNDKAKKLIAAIADKYDIKEVTPTDGGLKKPRPREVANAIIAKYDAGISNQQSTGTMVIEPTPTRLGGIFDKNGKKHQSGSVWDKRQVAPTLDTMQGGWRQPSVVVAKEEYGRMGRQAVETLNDNDVKHGDTVNPFGKRVSSKNGISPTLTTRPEGFKTAVLAVVDSIELPAIGTSRGRNPENPSYSTAGSPTVQRLEINKQGTSNTITTVQKDNYVIEPNVLTPKRTEYGKAIRKDYEKGLIKESRHNMTELQPRTDGISNTLTTVQKDNYVIEPLGTLAAHNSDKFGSGYMDGVSKTLKANKHDISVVERVRRLAETARPNVEIGITLKPNGDIRPHRMDVKKSGIQELNINHEDNLSHTVTSAHMPKVYGDITDLRIRKLTPTECWRLMGFSDDDFHKAEEVNSNSQLYKQAGNSIVVDVLEAIFKQLLED